MIIVIQQKFVKLVYTYLDQREQLAPKIYKNKKIPKRYFLRHFDVTS